MSAGFVAYTTEDGLPQSQVLALAQDDDGTLWIGTASGGLARFDGRTFERWRSADRVPSATIDALLTSPEGDVYVGAAAGVYRVEGERAVRLAGATGRGTDLASGPDGVYALVDEAVYRVTDDALVPVDPTLPASRHLAVGQDGALWLAGIWGVGRLDDGAFVVLEATDGTGRAIREVTADPRGGAWIGSTDGLFHTDGGPLVSRGVDPSLRLPIEDIAVDRTGTVWVSTRSTLVGLGPEGEQVLRARGSLGPSPTTCKLLDREGNVFVGTNGDGLVMLPRGGARRLKLGDLTEYAPTSSWVGDDGARFIGTIGSGLWRIDASGAAQAVPGVYRDVFAITRRASGGAWIGGRFGIWGVDATGIVARPELPPTLGFATTAAGTFAATTLGLYRAEGEVWTRVDGLPTDLRDVLARPDGALWLTSHTEGIALYDPASGRVLERVTAGDLPVNGLVTLDADPSGTLWLATVDGLLERRPDGTSAIHTSADGLPDDMINWVTHDPVDGTMWVGTNRGVAARIDGKWRLYDHRRGLPAAETIGRGVHWEGDSLWIGTTRGWGIFDQTPPPKNTAAPLVSVRASRDGALATEGASIPRDGRPVRFDVQAVSLSAPERMTVRYRLAGVEDWTTTQARTLQYPGLAAGRYAFEVVACNEDDVCSEPTSYALTVVPAWWETAGFRALSAAGALVTAAGLAWGVQALRQGRLRRDNERLERVVAARTRDLAVEKDKSDRLLHDILPDPVVAELKDRGAATSRRYDDVTILFTDLQGFTKISGEQSPERIVSELNELFAAFDSICREHHLEKLKTIGDAYMAAGGLPLENTTHALDAVRAALAMQQYVEGRGPELLPFRLRIGLHTGPVVAGVIGTWKFAYDIWGDAVNIAARMESAGEVGEVNLSEATWSRVSSEVPCVARGLVHAKGKGDLAMYFVDRAGRARARHVHECP